MHALLCRFTYVLRTARYARGKYDLYYLVRNYMHMQVSQQQKYYKITQINKYHCHRKDKVGQKLEKKGMPNLPDAMSQRVQMLLQYILHIRLFYPLNEAGCSSGRKIRVNLMLQGTYVHTHISEQIPQTSDPWESIPAKLRLRLLLSLMSFLFTPPKFNFSYVI